MTYPVVSELADAGVPVAVTCRVLNVSTSGYYEWRSRRPSSLDLEQAHLMNTIRQVHAASYGTYGHRRVHAELVLGRKLRISRGRVERLMRCTGLQGVHRRRLRGCTRRDTAAIPSADLVERNFNPTEPDRLYVADITQHRTSEGWLYLAVVLDCFSRRVVGWAMADHIRSELVVDALQMAIWNRKPAPGAIHHSDHGSTYTSWAFGHRLRDAGLLGSMGSIGDCFDNSVAESFFATLQTELLDRSTWPTREGLANAVFAFHRGIPQPPPSALHPRLPQPRRDAARR
ncbi:MAG: Mobile element protein [uncultured Propionibacteriaceae bacterium]|uniref:Mobile element protein n=1 Tax=uncultured Propionibacteriaceae bacterium TaxID=257457 RepID=A0A6J4NHW2_9ACTN|nr:MAG: Mobile element protein [uncultured Propionibacteriaceae bacterium]